MIAIFLNCFFNYFLSFEDRLEKFMQRRRLIHELRVLTKLGMQLNIVYDIGARVGLWTKLIKTALPSAKFICFEADDKCKNALEKSSDKALICVLSDTNRQLQFYRGTGTGDSYYLENSPFFKGVVPETIAAKTLESICIENKLPSPDFIKIDTQGSELDILKGGGEFLNNVKLVYLEISILPCNRDAPLISTYIEQLLDYGFIPLRITEQIKVQWALVQVDILFIKKELGNKYFGDVRGICI